MAVSHNHASWWSGWKGQKAAYPGESDGRVWNRQALVEFYEPWAAVEAAGCKVHMGEFGCFDQTPNDVALRWLTDLFSVWREKGWGWAMWNFEGPFGIIGHRRAGARFELMDGYLVDRDLFELARP
jgi:hypothetical protein